MRPDGVVEGLQIGEHISLSAGPGGVVVEVNQLALEAAEEIFRHGVVVGIALAGHALPDPIGIQLRPKGRRRILDAPITVKDEPLGRFAAAYGHAEGFQRQRSVDALRKGITHDFPGAQVLHDGQVEPAFPGWNVGDIAHPGLIWTLKVELSLQKVGCGRMVMP